MLDSSLAKSLRERWPIVLAVLVILLAASAILVSRTAVLAAPDQPLDFSHRQHSDAGVGCLFCHSNAMRSNIAGLPSVQLCVGCHRTIAREEPPVQQIFNYWDADRPIPWQPVTEMPDHVFFSHAPHLQSGLNCETCHGNVGGMARLRPVVRMDMGWCLDCHLDQRPDRVARLTDCLTCHK
jgi:hypothetical protein